jgi:hypothetical protein
MKQAGTIRQPITALESEVRQDTPPVLRINTVSKWGASSLASRPRHRPAVAADGKDLPGRRARGNLSASGVVRPSSG